jgi:hypothetical protein
MADFVYQLTLPANQLSLENLRAIVLPFIGLTDWTITSEWRAVLQESVVIFTALVSTSPTINKADLDATFLNIATQIKTTHPVNRVVIINYPVQIQAVL